MKFSILIPVYNVEQYLSYCLDSVKQQTFRDFEVVIVDDGSTDKSGKILDEFAKENRNIRVIHKKNEGLISARRVGIQNAMGEYFVFCDSDDLLELDALEKINNVIEHYHADLVIYKAYRFDGKEKKPFAEPGIEEGIISDKEIIYNHFYLDYSLNALWIKAVKRDLVDIKGDYSAFYSSNLGEDLLQSVPLIKRAKKIYYLNEYLYNYRISSGMMKKYNSKYYWEYKAVNEEICKILKDDEIADISIKSSFYILMAAYGATTQFKYIKKITSTELSAIADDRTFRNAYTAVFKSGLLKRLSKKQRFIISNLYKKNYLLIDFALMIPRWKIMRRKAVNG